MNKEHFWEIIDRTTIATTKEEQLELFRWELQQLSIADLDSFGWIFRDYFVEAYNWDLWLVAWLATGGMCSDDGFHYLRLWLISKGQDVCEAALTDPESAAELIYEADSPTFERFGYVLTEVRNQKTTQPPSNSGGPHPKQPSRGDWLRPELKDRTGSHILNLCVVFSELTHDDFVVVQTRFPRLWDFCLRKGIIKTGVEADASPKNKLPTPEQIAATIDPNLAKTDFAAYLKACGDAAREAYKKRE
jgi:Protein of unknown function (DUF4240)